MICENISRNEAGELTFAGRTLTALAEKYGTPLYLYDEARIRTMCRTYRDAARAAFGDEAMVLYASKAASFSYLYGIMQEEGMGIDVVSAGEICAAARAGFPLGRAYFHSNNKTDADILYGIEMGVGYFVADNAEELYAIERIAAARGTTQRVLLRLTPGIDPHTYAAVATGKVDSKFGAAIETGQADENTRIALSLPHVTLCGFHCHLGSQVFDADVYLRASRVMLDFVAHAREAYGYTAEELDIGGGLGVRYVEEQPTLDIPAVLREVGAFMQEYAVSLGIALPHIRLEPGRSIVADAGLTLYTVGTVKDIPGYKTYISVDGSMADNPRYALYGSPYTILPVIDSEAELRRVSVVGRCCESGDILQENVLLPTSLGRGDLLACLTTGAYHYSMSSNYNRLPRPPVVMLRPGGEDKLIIRRETVEDLLALEV